MMASLLACPLVSCFSLLCYGTDKLWCCEAPERKREGKEREKEGEEEGRGGKKEKALGDKDRAEAEKQVHRKRHYGELSQCIPKTVDTTKTREDDGEQLEKSTLTEERGGPAAVQSLCDSSDSTQNSSKRSKHESLGVTRTTHGNNGLRIRLPLSRHKDTESRITSEQPCSSGRAETVPAARGQEGPKAAVRHDPPSSAEQPCFSGRTSATLAEELQETADGKPAEPCRVHSGRSSRDREARRTYRKLILEWNPPPLQVENPEDDDQDWLFGKTSTSGRRQHGEGETRGEEAASEGAGLGSALCSWPPRACFLPEVGIHALPYVVPF